MGLPPTTAAAAAQAPKLEHLGEEESYACRAILGTLLIISR